MSLILGLDPGTTQSAVVVYDTDARRVEEARLLDNEPMLFALGSHLGFVRLRFPDAVLVIEKLEGMGMPVGAETMETIFWTGRFYQAWPRRVERVSRRDVKLHLCGSVRAKDANVRQALIDKLGKPGTKRDKGPTYGVSSHAWAALAVAVTWHETKNQITDSSPKGAR